MTTLLFHTGANVRLRSYSFFARDAQLALLERPEAVRARMQKTGV
jgi:hypothetical protein